MLGGNKGDAMKIRSAPFGLLLSVLLLVPGTPALAQTLAPAAEVVWSATNDFAGKMMDIDRFDNVYSVGDTIVGGIVLTRKFSPDGLLLWERSYRPEFAVKASWVAADPNGGAYVAGSYTLGILKYSPGGVRQWVCPAVNPNGNTFPGTPLPTGLYLSADGSSVAASGTRGYNYYVLSCD